MLQKLWGYTAFTHNALRDEFSCETDLPLPGYPLIPADVFVSCFVDEDLTINAAVVHPLPNSLSATATVTAGAAVQAREEAKADFYAANMRHQGLGVHCLWHGDYRGMGPGCTALLQTAGARSGPPLGRGL